MELIYDVCTQNTHRTLPVVWQHLYTTWSQILIGTSDATYWDTGSDVLEELGRRLDLELGRRLGQKN